MKPNAFIGQETEPTSSQLEEVLGRVAPLWEQLVAELARRHEVTEREWNSYSKKAGWSLRLKRKGRAIVYLIPCRRSIGIAFALGDRAVAAARESGLPPRILAILDEARRYAEGTALRFDVTRKSDVQIVSQLAAIKIAH